MSNIILVGFMGTGKSSIGKEVAKRLSMQFVDLDDLIEQDQNMSIPEIFLQKGEPYFREVEKKIVALTIDMDNTVVACGGGVVLFDENWENLREAGSVICLTSSAEAIFERTKQFTHRPLLNVEDPVAKIRELLEIRAPYYAKADHTIDCSELSVEQTADKVIEYLKNRDKG